MHVIFAYVHEGYYTYNDNSTYNNNDNNMHNNIHIIIMCIVIGILEYAYNDNNNMKNMKNMSNTNNKTL